jgi:hypothetical protein
MSDDDEPKPKGFSIDALKKKLGADAEAEGGEPLDLNTELKGIRSRDYERSLEFIRIQTQRNEALWEKHAEAEARAIRADKRGRWNSLGQWIGIAVAIALGLSSRC